MVSSTFQPVALERETRATLPTFEASFHLNRAEQTLRLWHSQKSGPPGLNAVLVRGRLAWNVSEIKQALGLGVAQ